MTFSWKLYIALAQALAKDPICSGNPDLKDGEIQANYRAALSRAYYGLFSEAYNYLRDVEHDFALMMPIRQQQGEVFEREEVEKVQRDTKSIHDYLIRKLQHDVADKRKSGLRKGLRKALMELKERRVEADYREATVFDSRTVQMAIKEAVTALSFVSQLSS